jgi:tetratricopeptide (TPR) repeat protein
MPAPVAVALTAVALISTVLVAALTVPAAAQEAAGLDSLVVRADRALSWGQFARADELLQKAVAIDDDDPRVNHGLAIKGLIEDDADFAIEHARKAVQKDKKNSEYRMTLANGYGMKAQQGGMSAVYYGRKYREECQKAIKYDPENVEAYFGLLYFYVYAPSIVGGGKDRAREQAEKIREIDPMSGHSADALIAQVEGDTVAVEAAYVAATETDSTSANAWWTLGVFWSGQGRVEESLRAFERAAAAAPESPSISYQLAKARLESGVELEAAADGFGMYIESERRPDYPPLAAAHWRRGEVFEALDRLEDAKAEWEAALEADREYLEAEEALRLLEAEHPELW